MTLIDGTDRDHDLIAAPADMVADDALAAATVARVMRWVTLDGRDPGFRDARRAAAILAASADVEGIPQRNEHLPHAHRAIGCGTSLEHALVERLQVRVLMAHPDGHRTLAHPNRQWAVSGRTG